MAAREAQFAGAAVSFTARTARLGALLAFTALPVGVIADDPSQRSSAQFYVVGADGRSAPDPEIERVLPPPPSSPPAPAPRPPGVRIEVHQTPARERDDFEEMRCEQAGFYFTNDGRCVVPARVVRRPRRSM
jgi:hypothetical protein